jgi:hypothetical protein
VGNLKRGGTVSRESEPAIAVVCFADSRRRGQPDSGPEGVGAKIKEAAGRKTPGAPRNGEPLKRSKPKRASGRGAA